jgi:MFS family permease
VGGLGAVFSVQSLFNTDRTAIPLAAPMIIAEFGFSPSAWGWILSAFSIGYVPFLLVGGWAADKIGPRRGRAGVIGGICAYPGRGDRCPSPRCLVGIDKMPTTADTPQKTQADPADHRPAPSDWPTSGVRRR